MFALFVCWSMVRDMAGECGADGGEHDVEVPVDIVIGLQGRRRGTTRARRP